MATAPQLSRREREIMDVLYRLGQATAAEVLTELADPPGYSAIRATLRILEDKGHVHHQQDGARYVYLPKLPRDSAKKSALKHVVHTFFEGSAAQVVSALVDNSAHRLTRAELDEIAQLIERARTKGKS